MMFNASKPAAEKCLNQSDADGLVRKSSGFHPKIGCQPSSWVISVTVNPCKSCFFILFLIDPCHSSLIQARWKLCGKTCCGLRPAVEYPMVCTMKLGGQPCKVSLFWEYFDDCLSGKSRMMKDNEADQYGSFN